MKTDDNDDLEQLLGAQIPRGAPPVLRSQVLEAMGQELETSRDSFMLRRAASVTAASVLLAIALNYAVTLRTERRLAQIYGPRPGSNQGVEVAKAAVKLPGGRPVPDAFAKDLTEVERLIRKLQTFSEDLSHEPPHQAAPEEDRHRVGRDRGDTSYRERLVRLDFRYTA